jgi:NodT family efflux transporter outer membrane factor (OMF) lipoprotein
MTRAILAIPFVLAACTSIPATRELVLSAAPVPVASPGSPGAPAARHSTAEPRASRWPDLGDSVLTALLLEARRANGDILVAEQRLNAARASRRLAVLDQLPRITATGSSMRQQLSIAGVPGLTHQLPAQQLWDVGFDASYELDFFGRIGNAARAQQTLVASNEYSVDDVQLSVEAEVARSYFELRGAQRQLAVALRNAENQRHIVKLTEDRLAAGRGNAFDTERAKSELYLTLAATPQLEADIAAQREQIAVLVGRAPRALPATLFIDAPPPKLPDTVDMRPDEAIVRHRPDVQAAERKLAAQTMLVGAARAEYLPRVALSVHGGYAANSFDSLSRSGTSRWLAGPVVSFPFLDLGRVRQYVDLARAERDAAQAEYKTTVVRAISEGNTAVVRYDRAKARLAVLETAATASARAAQLAQERFDAGLTDFLQVLDAQRTLLDAENQLAIAQTAAATALVAAYKAAGGSWSAP